MLVAVAEAPKAGAGVLVGPHSLETEARGNLARTFDLLSFGVDPLEQVRRAAEDLRAAEEELEEARRAAERARTGVDEAEALLEEAAAGSMSNWGMKWTPPSSSPALLLPLLPEAMLCWHS